VPPNPPEGGLFVGEFLAFLEVFVLFLKKFLELGAVLVL